MSKENIIFEAIHKQGINPETSKIYEIGEDLSKYPLPAISPNFRRVLKAFDVYVLEDNQEKRFIVRDPFSLKIIPNSKIFVPSTEILEKTGFQILEIPADSLYLKYLMTDNTYKVDRSQVLIQASKILQNFKEENPDFETTLQEQYGESLSLEDLFCVSVKKSTLIFLG